MTQQITGAAFKSMLTNAAAAIELHKREINDLNVFPVPDGDTGTNMSLTMASGAKAAAEGNAPTISTAAEITAGALLRGARGNSGVILSLLFRGFSKYLKDYETADSSTFANALLSGVDAAYKAVMKPAEGTILTVSRVIAGTAVSLSETESDIETLLERVLEAGFIALAETTGQNPVLKKAGVVDAGAKGYLYILDGMLKALRGEVIEVVQETVTSEKAVFSEFSAQDILFTYCTEFIVNRENPKAPHLLSEFLDSRGDSLVVVDDDEIIKVHVHTNDPGAVLTEALTYGTLLTVKIENMREQHTEKVFGEDYETEQAAVEATPEKQYGIVAVCAGDGIISVFNDLGVDSIVSGGQTMNPSTDDILRKVNATPSETVFVLPNNKNIIMAAEQCAPLTGKNVIVIPSRTVPQGISAMLSFDATAPEAENADNMRAAVKNVHTALITYAARDSEYDGHSIREGEYLALLEDSLVVSTENLFSAVETVANAMNGFSPEFVTVFSGEGVSESETEDVVSRFSTSVPNAETTAIFGGQPVYKFIISAE